uniref:Uncharacterized protein n=1 Tax=Anguilla anguilla TaxID=7936 RepID=A0A0E9PS44_ANGAN
MIQLRSNVYYTPRLKSIQTTSLASFLFQHESTRWHSETLEAYGGLACLLFNGVLYRIFKPVFTIRQVSSSVPHPLKSSKFPHLT